MIEVLKQARKAFEVATTPLAKDRQEVLEAVAAINQAIAELESQEPVAWNLADKVRQDLDRQSCPDAFMRIAVESIVKHHPPQRTEQEPVACDGDFPEGFDESLGIPAQALRQANAALCEVTNNRMWDVPALAERMLLFCRNTHPPQRTEKEPVAIDWERIAKVQNAKLMAMCDEAGGFEKLCEVMNKYKATHPPQRTWVGLTSHERMMCRSYYPDEAVAKTEAKLKEKNT